MNLGVRVLPIKVIIKTLKYMKEYIQKNEKRFLEELFEILRIPSISSLEANKGDMVVCANKLGELLMAA